MGDKSNADPIRIFISSTVYYLEDLRSELKHFIETEFGANPVLSSDPGFRKYPGLQPWENCLIELRTCTLIILIIDYKYGTPLLFKNITGIGERKVSPTHGEYLDAHFLGKNIRIYVRNTVYHNYQSYRKLLKNKSIDSDDLPKYLIDTISTETFAFYHEVKTNSKIEWIRPFDNVGDIKDDLRKQIRHLIADQLRLIAKEPEALERFGNILSDSASITQINGKKGNAGTKEGEKSYWSELTNNDLQEPKNSNYSVKFLNGGNPKWFIIEKSTFQRDMLTDIKAYLKSNNVALITGAGGEGKSTLLHQLGVSYFKDKFQVLYNFGHEDTIDLNSLKFNKRSTILLLDNADEKKNLLELFGLIELYNSKSNREVKIVIVSRKNQWEHSKNNSKNRLELEREIDQEFELEKLSATEIQRLIKLFIDSPINLHFNKENLQKMIESKKNDFLLSTMLTITTGKTFEKTIEDILGRIQKMSDNGYYALLSLAIIVIIELKVKRREGEVYCTKAFLKECLKEHIEPKKVNQTFTEIQDILIGEALFQDNGMKITTRNILISELYFKYLFNEEKEYIGLDNVFETILHSAIKLESSFGELLLYNIPSNIIKENTDLGIKLFKLTASFGYFCHESYKWINAEIDKDNIGSYDDKYSARWICKTTTEKTGDPLIFMSWAKMEFQHHGIGEYETPYSARWICKEGIIRNNTNVKLYILLAKLEFEYGTIGDFNTPYTARWIYIEGVEKCAGHHEIYKSWAESEFKYGGVGNYKNESTARWVCREGIEKNNKSVELYRLWAMLEFEHGIIGDYNKINSASWVCKEGIKNCAEHHKLYIIWAKIEFKKGFIGNFETKNSARWICKEGINKNNKNIELYEFWASLEIEHGIIGDYETENSARWICKNIALLGSGIYGNTVLIIKWICIEFIHNNIGNYDEEYSFLGLIYNFFNLRQKSKFCQKLNLKSIDELEHFISINSSSILNNEISIPTLLD